MDAIESVIEWLKSLFTDLTEFLGDLPVKILKGLLDAIAGLIELIPVPDFITNGLQTVVSGFPPTLLWMMDQTGIPEALAIYGAGVSARLLRKVFTLFQW